MIENRSRTGALAVENARAKVIHLCCSRGGVAERDRARQSEKDTRKERERDTHKQTEKESAPERKKWSRHFRCDT